MSQVIFKEEKSFFEHLRIADSERVHSEFLSWLLSPECEAITDCQRNELIERIFKLRETRQVIGAGTEINNVDIFIETNNSILIIENKIKSSQHSNQLFRYKELVKKDYPNKEHRFIFLTLIQEQKVDNDWVHISYCDILEQLSKMKLSTNRHAAFVEDYILYLQKLLSVLNDVILKPKEYPNVFKNGSLKKSDKLLLEFGNKKEEFISKNQLETIFQKAFLTKLLENEEIRIFRGFLTDTRGTALIDFPLKRDISIGGRRLYTTFIQMQGDNIKFAFAIQENYLDSKREWISQIIDIFKGFKSQKLSDYKKINSPKSLAYVSISKKMNRPYWTMELEEIISMIKSEIKIGHELTQRLILEIENTVGNTV